MIKDELRNQIMKLIGNYHNQFHQTPAFVPGSSVVPVSGRVYDAEDMQLLTDSALDFWLTTGRFNDQFEAHLSQRLSVRHVLTVNSGSSANLVAFSSLTSSLLRDKAIRPGDEVITVAAGFPTTVNPILQNKCIPVFVDVEDRKSVV